MIDAGILVGASIGMKPIEAVYNAKRDGTDFLKQELLEWSVVSIPANSNAIRQRCVGGHCDEKAIRKWLGVEAAIPPVPTQEHDNGTITFELEDLKTAIVETLRREVKTRLTGLVH